MAPISQIQLGKQGITENFLNTLENNFINHAIVKISVLKSAGHDKSKIKSYSEEILNALGKNFTAKIVGFKITIRKWKKIKR